MITAVLLYVGGIVFFVLVLRFVRRRSSAGIRSVVPRLRVGEPLDRASHPSESAPAPTTCCTEPEKDKAELVSH